MNAIGRGLATIGIAALAVFPGARAAADPPSLAGTAWVSREPDCEVRQLQFDTDTVRLRMTWTTASAGWTLTGARLDLSPERWEAKLAGEFKADNQLLLTFDWMTTDYARHVGRCTFTRTP